jgi:aminoglycoside N3'-acetyltransferase
VSSIAYDLSSSEIRKTQAVHLVSLLSRLDQVDLARETFLKARREVMLKRVRAIKAEGDISIYISELSIVCFTIIRHTSDWYMTAFKENRMASGEFDPG